MPCNDPAAVAFAQVPPGLCLCGRVESDNHQVTTSVQIVSMQGLAADWSQSDLDPGPACLELEPADFYVGTVRILFLKDDVVRFRWTVRPCAGEDTEAVRTYCHEARGRKGDLIGLALSLRTV